METVVKYWRAGPGLNDSRLRKSRSMLFRVIADTPHTRGDKAAREDSAFGKSADRA